MLLILSLAIRHSSWPQPYGQFTRTGTHLNTHTHTHSQSERALYFGGEVNPFGRLPAENEFALFVDTFISAWMSHISFHNTSNGGNEKSALKFKRSKLHLSLSTWLLGLATCHCRCHCHCHLAACPCHSTREKPKMRPERGLDVDKADDEHVPTTPTQLVAYVY